MGIISAFPGGTIRAYSENVRNFAAFDSYGQKLILFWNDPNDSAWSGTLIRRKLGEFPVDENDGELVVDNTVRDAYAVTGFEDTTAASGEVYYYKAFPYSGIYYSNNSVNTTKGLKGGDAAPTIEREGLRRFVDDSRVTLTFPTLEGVAGIRLVYKEGSWPSTIGDGSIVEDITNGGKQNAYVVGGLTNGIKYYFKLFPYYDTGFGDVMITSVYPTPDYLVGSNNITATPKPLPARNTLENLSWEEIKTVADSGYAEDWFRAGDTKTCPLPATVQGSSSVVVEVAGLRYDYLASGRKAPISFIMADGFTTRGTMNSTATNDGEWEATTLRETCNTTYYEALSAALGENVIAQATKAMVYQDLAGGIYRNVTKYIKDYVWVPSAFEVFGTSIDYGTTNVPSGECASDRTECYPVFTDAASRVKKSNGSAYTWFTRSVVKDAETFGAVSSSGAFTTSAANASRGIAVGFCVGDPG